MGVANKFYSKLMNINWAVVTVAIAILPTTEILWIRKHGAPEINSLWYILFPIPFILFMMAFFMWTMSSHRKKKSLINLIQLIFSVFTLLAGFLFYAFWIGLYI